jgi:hypothetical protein
MQTPDDICVDFPSFAKRSNSQGLGLPYSGEPSRGTCRCWASICHQSPGRTSWAVEQSPGAAADLSTSQAPPKLPSFTYFSTNTY